MILRSAEALLAEAYVGKTLVKLEYSDEPLAFPRKIVGIELCTDEDGDAKVYFELEEVEGSEDYEEERVYAYGNEGIEVR